ncbi:MAG: hypothetical protein JSV66_15470 [Trueperaceae bacterium]|nr:MAG: hypothetical protein JSV66_15470 [Trueperaceae bacterium]
MKRNLLGLITLLGIALAGSALAQVATVEVVGVEATAPHSPSVVNALLRDESVGEVAVVIRALDAGGNPVAGAAVSWRVQNRTGNTVYVVGSSAVMAQMLERAVEGFDLAIDGGVTDADGHAYLVVDSATSGDARVYVTVDGVDGKTYDGRDMRVVWF